jgi:hypothetical protein
LIDALDRVLSWDLPDESCSRALTAEAALLARVDPEEVDGVDLD